MNLIKMLLAASLLWAGAALADPPPGYPFVGYDAGLKAARASGKPIFLYFGRYGCAWCDHTNKKIFFDAVATLDAAGSLHVVWLERDEAAGTRIRYARAERR